MIRYLETSAAMKLLVDEPESPALVSFLQLAPTHADESFLVSSWLLHTELQCATNRHPDDIDLDSVRIVLDTVSLVDVTRGDLLTAGTLPGRLRSHDAVHLSVALRIGADEIVTYDAELTQAATVAGIPVTAPR